LLSLSLGIIFGTNKFPSIPTKYGIKVKIRADSENGYCNEFEIYTGKSGDHVNAKLGLTTRVVLNLTKKIENKNHIVNIDNYFTSEDKKYITFLSFQA
jgi:hypothetical protein